MTADWPLLDNYLADLFDPDPPVADGSLHTPDLPIEGTRFPELAELLGRRAAADADLVVRARADPNDFIEAIGRIEGQVWVGKQAGAHRMWQDHLTRASLLPGASTAVIGAAVGHAKALPVDTPIAVPGGWRAIGELAVGDEVISGEGRPVVVTAVSPVWRDREVFELTFDDGTSLRCDGEHLWSAWTVNDRSSGRPPRTVSTRDIIAKFTRANGQRYWSIPLAGPIEHPFRDLSVHPYVLGVWLGDGATDCTRIVAHEDDAEVVDRCIELEGGRCGERTYKPGTRVFVQAVGGIADRRANHDPRNLRGRLRALGVLGDKHIPADYLTASVEQRRELLAGLMDTDGTVGRLDGRLSFCSTVERLARGVLVLARSLGFKATIIAGPAKLHGVEVGTAWRVCWTTRDKVFRLRRKHEVHLTWARRRDAAPGPKYGFRRNAWEARTITTWRRVESVPVRCITVAAESATYIATDQCVVTHNSTQITRWRVLWEIGKNPNLRVLLLSATSQLPEKMLSGIKADIEHNAFVQAVFPHLRPGVRKGQNSWSNTQIHLDRADNLTDPSIECAGLTTKILGKRVDLIVADDFLNVENTLTPYMRKQVWDKIQAEALSRRPPHLPSRAWFLGHPWTEDDAMAQACMQPGVRKLITGARVQRTSTGRIITSADPEWNEIIPWVPLIPQLWTKAALEQRIASLGWAARFMIDCLFMRKGGMGFSPEALALALMNGRGLTFMPTWNPLTTGDETYTGVDVSSGEAEDETVILTAVKIRATGRRRILEIQAGKWTGPEIMERIHDVYRRYKSTIAVESNGVQKWLRQFIRDDSAHITPVVDHHTGSNKHALGWGIKHMEMELAAPGRWIFPRPLDMFEQPCAEVMSLVRGALNYSGDIKHTSDYLMAWWICWLAMAKDEGVALK